jgi:hypothetical protein
VQLTPLCSCLHSVETPDSAAETEATPHPGCVGTPCFWGRSGPRPLLGKKGHHAQRCRWAGQLVSFPCVAPPASFLPCCSHSLPSQKNDYETGRC